MTTPLNSQKSPMTTSAYCTFPRRLAILFYDSIIMLGLLIVGSAVALPFGETQKIALQDFWFTLWLVLVCFAYLGGCWHYGGMTVGMRAWRVTLKSRDGGKISWPRCMLRFLLGFVSLAALGLGFVWALFDRENRSWHDIAANTVLLNTEKPEKT